MKKCKLIFLLLLFVVSGFTVLYPGGNIVNHTGSPVDGGGDCSACHSGGATVPVITIDASPAFGVGNTYVPGTTYTLSLTVNGYPYFGFDVEILNGQLSTSADAGAFGPAGANSKYTIADPYPTNVTQIGPVPAGSIAKWNWTAPASGNVYIYASGLGVNGDGMDMGDRVGNFMLALNPLVTGMEEKTNALHLDVFPNPVSSAIHLTYTLDQPGSVCIQLMDVSGREASILLIQEQEAGEHRFDEAVPAQLKKGIYMLHLCVNGKVAVKRMIVK
jgi:hypothetical protein